MVSSKAIAKLRRSWWRLWQRNLSAHGAPLGCGQTTHLDDLSHLDNHCLHLQDVDGVHRRHNSYAHRHQMVLVVRVGELKRKTSSRGLPHSPLSLSGTPQGPQTFMTRDSSFLDLLTRACS